MADFKTFMNLTDFNRVTEITEILRESNIQFKVQDTSKDFDVTFSNNESRNSFLIMLNPKDFERGSLVLEEEMPFNINEIDNQHPLFLFSTTELKEVVKNYDEWHPVDVRLAKYLLDQQNIRVEDEEISQHKLKKELMADQHEKPSLLTLVIGYSFCLFGGLAGIGIAIYILTGKKTLTNGK